MNNNQKIVSYALEGNLDFVSVPKFAAIIDKILLSNHGLQLDLAQINIGDITGVGWLVDLVSRAKQQHKTVELLRVPKQLLKLMETVKVKAFLPLKS